MPERFIWTAVAEMSYPKDLNPNVREPFLSALENEFIDRAPVWRFSPLDSTISVALGIRSEAEEAARSEAKTLVGEAISQLGLSWLQLDNLRVKLNSNLDSFIDRIDRHTGQLRPEATIIQFPTKTID